MEEATLAQEEGVVEASEEVTEVASVEAETLTDLGMGTEKIVVIDMAAAEIDQDLLHHTDEKIEDIKEAAEDAADQDPSKDHLEMRAEVGIKKETELTSTDHREALTVETDLISEVVMTEVLLTETLTDLLEMATIASDMVVIVMVAMALQEKGEALEEEEMASVAEVVV